MIFAFSNKLNYDGNYDNELLFKELTLSEFKENVVYCGAFLHMKEYKFLVGKLKQIKKILGTKWSNVFCEHCTLGFGQKDAERFIPYIGDKCTVHVSSRVICNKDLCCLEVNKIHNDVQLMRLDSVNNFPHVTMATAKNIKPSQSNDVLDQFYASSVTGSVEMYIPDVEPQSGFQFEATVFARMNDGTFATYAANQIRWNRDNGFSRF